MSHNPNGRKARSKNKNIDRRIKRREHDRVVRAAIAEYEADVHDNERILWELDRYDDYITFDDLYPEDPWEDDYHDYYDIYEDYDDPDYGQYDDLHDNCGFDLEYDYRASDRFMNTDFDITRSAMPKMHYAIKQEDVGQSLGDILSRLID